jgi:hypothetical protein
MGTTQTFSAMLNQYLPIELLKMEYVKRDYLMQRVNMDESWKGGTLVVPFQSQFGSSIEFGQLAASTDVSEYKYTRGTISTQPEAWATLLFNHRDLLQHDGKMPESTFLRILPGQIEGMLNYFKMVISVHLMGDGSIAVGTVDGTAGGVLGVDRIDRFQLDQKCVLNDDGTVGQTTVYVIAINVNTSKITVSATRGGAALSIATYTVAHAVKVYSPGSISSGMTSIRAQLLSAANGGASTLFGQTKLNAPFLQAVNIDGSAISAANILGKVFDAYTTYKITGQGGLTPEIVMSFKHFGSILKLLEASKGPFNIVPNSRKVNNYGWDTIEIGSVAGQTLKIVGIQEMANDNIYFMDWDTWTFYSNGLFKRRKAPDGKEYFEVRNTSGYAYLLDHCIFGDLVCTAPWKNAVIYAVANY